MDFGSEPDVDALAQQLGWKAEFLEEDGGLEHIPKANIYQSCWVNELWSSPPCVFLWGAGCHFMCQSISLYSCIDTSLSLYIYIYIYTLIG